MHDTLANRGRINYSKYSNEELMQINSVTQQFLSGEVDDIDQIDSLRMIREIFNSIRNEYKRSFQHIESLKRQMDENPEKFKQLLQEQADADEKAQTPEEAKQEEAK